MVNASHRGALGFVSIFLNCPYPHFVVRFFGYNSLFPQGSVKIQE